MTINGHDALQEFGARQHHVKFGFHKVNNGSEWIRGAIRPNFQNSWIEWKTFSIDYYIHGDGWNDIREKTSRLLGLLLEPAEMELDGIDHMFHAVMTNYSVNEVVLRRKHKVTIDFQGYEYGQTVSKTGTGTVIVTNPGTMLSPLRLEITPNASASNVIISGACRDIRTGEDLPITLGTMTKDRLIVLDGITGIFSEAGALKSDITIQTMPAIMPGVTEIVGSNLNMSIRAIVKPLYM